MFSKLFTRALGFVLIVGFSAAPKAGLAAWFGTSKINVTWDDPTPIANKALPTLQVVVNPPLRRNSPVFPKVHDGAFAALKALKASAVRFVPWSPYPKLSVNELRPPVNGVPQWDSSLMDPIVEDFMAAQEDRSVMLNFSVIPQWMFAPGGLGEIPRDPNQVTWKYQSGTQLLRGPQHDLANYFARLAYWYGNGGFNVSGQNFTSPYKYKIGYWEVFNEINTKPEHDVTPAQYIERYDAIVERVRAVLPDTKFVGLSLLSSLGIKNDIRFAESFLDPRNHKPGIPLDMISYHFYAFSKEEYKDFDEQIAHYYSQAAVFLNEYVPQIEAIRKRLSPTTETAINEVGSINETPKWPIQPGYWNLSAGLFAYLYANLAKLGIEVIAESQLVGYPSQFPSVSMIDWKDGTPNARYWVLKLLIDNYGPGSKLVATTSEESNVFAQGFIKKDGHRSVLVVNKSSREQTLKLAGLSHAASIQTVDENLGGWIHASPKNSDDSLVLSPLAVTVVNW